ncbi:OmpA family protein [Alteromonas sediminis]|uniref:OmpA family protein n=1 Tax=Alteromonas sediminis TaxID=2259342 RepID=A0A3N5Y4G1_9ALTE|nr:OmpA family protein [Alteromonas sediminis]RPJ68420.1 OmpA family protein [Alteromonas sediminis]
MLRLSVLCFGLLCGSSHAAMRQYAAPVESSAWMLQESSRLTCALAHTLPGYGSATFTSMASKQLNMEFELDMKLLPKRFGTAAVYSVPPQWMPGKAQRKLADMTIRTQYNGDLPEDVAWTMLSELEKGHWPTIYYQDWYNQADKVAVSLNASNFYNEYQSFVNCVSNLLPYSFEDIAYTVLSYEKNSTKLTRYSQRQLEMIGEYLKEDTALELVLIDGHADSWGASGRNEQLSIRRANVIKDYFTQMGVEADRIDITGHGERRHIAPNDTPESRALNRRVIVQLSKV